MHSGTFHIKLFFQSKQYSELITSFQTDGQVQPTTLAERMKLQSKKCEAGEIEEKKSLYKDVGFICGSAAEVEPIQSICMYMLTNLSSQLTPLFFGALVYLKINADYQELKTIQDAYIDVLREAQN